MTGAVIIALLVIAGMIALVAWSVHGRVAAVERASVSDMRATTIQANLERSQFELAAVSERLEAANARATILEGLLNEEINANPNPDLARDDYRQRMLRINAEWARSTKGSVPAKPADEVQPRTEATDSPGPVVSPGDA